MTQRFRQEVFSDLVVRYDRLRQRLSGAKGPIGPWLVGRSDPGLPELRQVWLRIERHRLDQDAAELQVAQLSHTDGWLRRRSGVFMSHNGRLFPDSSPAAASGPPLNGEWCLGPSSAASLTMDRGQWHFTTLTELVAPEPSALPRGTQLPVLCQTISTSAQGGWRMIYRIYWGAENSQEHEVSTSIRRLCAAFAGFERQDAEATT
ncbi:MAG: hypothetical protein AB7P22_17455 [Vicinamibacterales bacterium]